MAAIQKTKQLLEDRRDWILFTQCPEKKTEIFLPKEDMRTFYPTELQLDYHILTSLNDHSANQHQNLS
jgi:hypothetical protein